MLLTPFLDLARWVQVEWNQRSYFYSYCHVSWHQLTSLNMPPYKKNGFVPTVVRIILKEMQAKLAALSAPQEMQMSFSAVAFIIKTARWSASRNSKCQGRWNDTRIYELWNCRPLAGWTCWTCWTWSCSNLRWSELVAYSPSWIPAYLSSKASFGSQTWSPLVVTPSPRHPPAEARRPQRRRPCWRRSQHCPNRCQWSCHPCPGPKAPRYGQWS